METLRRLRRAGVTCKQLAAGFQICPKSAERYTKEKNPRRVRKLGRKSDTDEKRDKKILEKFYELRSMSAFLGGGLTLSHVCGAAGCTLYRLRKILKAENISARKPTEKLMLKEKEKEARRRYCCGPASIDEKRNNVDVAIDCVSFQVPKDKHHCLILSAEGSQHVYRAPSERESDFAIRQSKKAPTNMGRKLNYLSMVFPDGECRLMKVSEKWSGETAAKTYRRLKKVLVGKHGARKKFRILEDNDTTGFKSKKGHNEKKKLGLSVFQIPVRSPDLSVCDFFLHGEIRRSLRSLLRHGQRKYTDGQMEKMLLRIVKKVPKEKAKKAFFSFNRRKTEIRKKNGGHIRG